MSNATNYVTPQEVFWAGDFGTEYIGRNNSQELLASNLKFFSGTLKQAGVWSQYWNEFKGIGLAVSQGKFKGYRD